MSETAEQERFRIFALTHKKPTQAADEWLADRRELAELREAAKELVQNVKRGTPIDIPAMEHQLFLANKVAALLQEKGE